MLLELFKGIDIAADGTANVVVRRRLGVNLSRHELGVSCMLQQLHPRYAILDSGEGEAPRNGTVDLHATCLGDRISDPGPGDTRQLGAVGADGVIVPA